MASAKSILKGVVRKAEKQATEAYTDRFRSHVLTYGWPEDVVSQMRIDYKDYGHTIVYPQSLEEQILTLEYGTQDIPNSPAIRTFMLGL